MGSTVGTAVGIRLGDSEGDIDGARKVGLADVGCAVDGTRVGAKVVGGHAFVLQLK